MNRSYLAAAIALVLGVASTACTTQPSADSQRVASTDAAAADWLTYHGTYKSWHYSGLDQINASNVGNLKVAWTHHTPRSTRGLQSFPLVSDGVLYYPG